jgi:hypothetical protein
MVAGHHHDDQDHDSRIEVSGQDPRVLRRRRRGGRRGGLQRPRRFTGKRGPKPTTMWSASTKVAGGPRPSRASREQRPATGQVRGRGRMETAARPPAPGPPPARLQVGLADRLDFGGSGSTGVVEGLEIKSPMSTWVCGLRSSVKSCRRLQVTKLEAGECSDSERYCAQYLSVRCAGA